MKRREFITLLGGAAAAAWPSAARAQKAAVPKVGYVYVGEIDTDSSGAGLRQGLADRGYEIGKNLILEQQYANGDSGQIPVLISELLARKVDVLVTVGTFASLAARSATSTVPIVCASGDPVKTGLVASLNRPGGNVTGISILANDYSAKWLELMKDLLPKLQRVAVLWNPQNPGVAGEVEQLRTAASALGVNVTVFVGTPKEIGGSFSAIAGGVFDGLIVTTDPSLEALTGRVIAFAADRRLPTMYPFSTAVQNGGLISYSIDFFDMWRRAASYVDRILKGASPADLPIEQATRVALKINVKTATSVGLTIPPTLLALADEVIE
jgi:putative tryptophan/tyrosine transport system substrate-binding protein